MAPQSPQADPALCGNDIGGEVHEPRLPFRGQETEGRGFEAFPQRPVDLQGGPDGVDHAKQRAVLLVQLQGPLDPRFKGPLLPLNDEAGAFLFPEERGRVGVELPRLREDERAGGRHLDDDQPQLPAEDLEYPAREGPVLHRERLWLVQDHDGPDEVVQLLQEAIAVADDRLEELYERSDDHLALPRLDQEEGLVQGQLLLLDAIGDLRQVVV
ncbi:MAG: hypothetical protein DRJ44_07025, partial [Thermoprotei archaeon]